MKIGTVNHQGQETLVIKVSEENAATLASAYAAAGIPNPPATLQEMIDRGQGEIDKAKRATDVVLATSSLVELLPIEGLDWLPPQPRPPKMLNVAVNNNDLNQYAFRKPTQPMFFLKPPTCLIGHGKNIELMEEHAFTVPEPEIAAVFKKGGKCIPVEDALDHLLGYTIQNDLTASGVKFNIDSVALQMAKPSDLRPHHTAWREKFGEEDRYLYFTYHTRSKGSDTFGPMGPWLVVDEIADPNNVVVRSWVDGEQYTEDTTANYMFDLAYAIHEASRYFTFQAGDIMSFGTAGLGVGRFARGNRDVNLQDFSEVVCEFEGIGVLSNPIVKVVR